MSGHLTQYNAYTLVVTSWWGGSTHTPNMQQIPDLGLGVDKPSVRRSRANVLLAPFPSQEKWESCIGNGIRFKSAPNLTCGSMYCGDSFEKKGAAESTHNAHVLVMPVQENLDKLSLLSSQVNLTLCSLLWQGTTSDGQIYLPAHYRRLTLWTSTSSMSVVSVCVHINTPRGRNMGLSTIWP